MTGTLGAMLTVIGLGVVYFVAAIPAGIGLHLSPLMAAFCAWIGYVGIAAAMLVVGEPARRWMERRFKISATPNPEKLFWRVWLRWGLPGLSLLAPVTCGPYFAALIALTLGEKPKRLMLWIAFGAVPWCVILAVLTVSGVSFLGKATAH